MSPVATRERTRKAGPKKRSARRGKKSWAAWWWPFTLALIATPFAVRGASVLALSGPAALRLLYPWMSLAQAAPSLAPEQRDTLAAVALWAQLPLYGLLLSLFALRRRWGAGLVTLLALHLLAIGAALWFVH